MSGEDGSGSAICSEEIQEQIIYQTIAVIPVGGLSEGLKVLAEAHAILEKAPPSTTSPSAISAIRTDPRDAASEGADSLLDAILSTGSFGPEEKNLEGYLTTEFLDLLLEGDLPVKDEALEESLDIEINLRIEKLSDFDPERLDTVSPDLRTLLELREKLAELRSRPTLRKSLQTILSRL